jgi:flagellar biosynthesis protein FlhF
VLDDVTQTLGEEGLDDDAAVREAVITALGDHIPVADQPLPMPEQGGGPLVVVLVGPTGVGKTTTIAKLAATYRIRRGLKVGLVTADTYRIAAVEQLRTYAHILGVPLHVAQTPSQLTDAIGELSSCDVVLVDTAGRGQRDQVKLDELSAFVKAAMPDEVHLVLSGTTSEAVLLKEAEAFSCVGIDRVALTKLDETVNFGVLVNVMDQLGTALSFVTTGQEVPEDLSEGSGRQLADLVLGGELPA